MSKPRTSPLGTRNIVGARVEQVRRMKGLKQHELLAMLQSEGMEISESGMSRLEGCTRAVQDYELPLLCAVLGISVKWLLGMEETINTGP